MNNVIPFNADEREQLEEIREFIRTFSDWPAEAQDEWLGLDQNDNQED